MSKFFVDFKPTEWANIRVVNWFVQYCLGKFGIENVHAIFLFGSRAGGVSSKNREVTQRSDHDFYVIISENFELPHDYRKSFETARVKARISSIDIMVGTPQGFIEDSRVPGTLPYKVRQLNKPIMKRMKNS